MKLKMISEVHINQIKLWLIKLEYRVHKTIINLNYITNDIYIYNQSQTNLSISNELISSYFSF